MQRKANRSPPGPLPRSPYVTTTCCGRPSVIQAEGGCCADVSDGRPAGSSLCGPRTALAGTWPQSHLEFREYLMNTATTQPELAGSVALITDGGRGVGRVLALALAGAGAVVGLIARSSDQLAESVQPAPSGCLRTVGRTRDRGRPRDRVPLGTPGDRPLSMAQALRYYLNRFSGYRQDASRNASKETANDV